MSIPAQQKALLLEYEGGPLVMQTVGVSQPKEDEILVKVEAAGLNPGDWKILENSLRLIAKFPVILGFDAAGTVVKVGGNVTTFSVGDRAAFQGLYHISTQSVDGTWAEYFVCPAKLAGKIPASISSDAAATIPSGIATAALPLYSVLGLTPPWAEGGRGKYAGTPFMVLGGATCIGQFVIQLARLNGFEPVIATASLHNADFLRSLGATHVLDRKLPADALKAEATKIAGGLFKYVFDSVSGPDTVQPAYDLTAPKGDLVVVLQTNSPKVDATEEKKIHFARGIFSLPMNHATAAELLTALPKFLESGEIKPNRTEVIPGGLNGVLGGLERLKKDEVSGVKLIVRPQETV